MELINRNITSIVEKAEVFKYCNTDWFQLTIRNFELPFRIEPVPSEIHDYLNCENCLKAHEQIIKDLTPRFEKFPFCCAPHSELAKDKKFNKEAFGDIPKDIADKVIFTTHHIVTNIDKDDWYNEITNYVDWAEESLGQLPYGESLFHRAFFDIVIDRIKRRNGLNKARKDRILEYLKTYITPPKKKDTDLKMLIETYEKWLKIFPFDLSYFSHLKEGYEKSIPILTGTPVYNKYLGIAKAKLHTKSSLIETLTNTTDTLITQINGLVLYKKWFISDVDKVKWELIIQSRKLKITRGYNNSSPEAQHRYRKMLKEWFEDEKQFINEIRPLLKANGAEEISPTINAMSGFLPLTEDLKRALREAGKYISEALKGFQIEFDKHQLNYQLEYESIISYLKASGKIVPKNHDDFFEWFLLHRHPGLIIPDGIPEIEDVDFELYHRYRQDVLFEKIAEIDNIANERRVAPDEKNEPRSTKRRTHLAAYGFFDLPTVKALTKESQSKLIDLICTHELPYCIAMFDFLGYLKYLEVEYFPAKYKLYAEVSKWFKSDKEGRAVKGNISSLLKNTTENKTRYTAYKHKEKVRKDYQELK